MKLYTGCGDDGSTGLFGGARVDKCDKRVAAYGEVDETNAAIGLALSACNDPRCREQLRSVQEDLFSLGAELATPDGQQPTVGIDQRRVRQLETWIDDASSRVSPLRNFILPGGCDLAARMHLARAVCRRAERSVTDLAKSQTVAAACIVYLNRLGDLLFALARVANRENDAEEITWKPAD